MKQRTTIFKQLVYNVLFPALLALIILGVINYNHTRQLMIDSNTEKNAMLVDQIKNILEFQDMSLEMLGSTLDERVKGYSNLLVDMYFSDTKNIETVNLKAIRDELGMDSSVEDLYIINTNGVVVNTTFDKDKGLNLFSFGIEHEKYLKSVFANKKFVSERFTIESTTKRLKKYSYQPTNNGKYIIEIGFYSTKADQIIDFIRHRLENLTEEQGSLKNVDLFILTDKPFSLNDKSVLNKEHEPIINKVFKDKQTVVIASKNNGRSLEFSYIYMDRKGSDLYKGSIIRIVSDRTAEYKMLRNELLKLFIIFSLAIITVIVLLYRKTRVITEPIKKLVESVNRITHGHLNERAPIEGHNEIAHLSKNFNNMVEELENLYRDLEQKVIDRTAEIVHQKEEIETQRDNIEQQRNLLMEINDTLEQANKEITEQKKHITDSIIYAKRIQNAILPPDDYIQRLLPEYFILYKPKDIVSGDFYWVGDKEGIVMVAAVDCTGHGVPGAFMSIVGFNNINFAVNIKGARKAGDILNELNQGVTDSLRQHRQVSTIRDGMDIALCCFDFENKCLSFAGANNPMFMVRDGEGTMFEPTKAPIGAYVGENLSKFQNNDVQIKQGDVFYVFSDGYADQFGGPDNKKFLKRHFREYLASIAHLPMNEQKIKLEQNFDNWKGDNEQLDDLLVIGVRYV